MSWAKLDDDFHDHPKVEAVGNEGAGVIARLISWSSRHLTDGIVPLWKVMAIASNRKIQDPAVREESARTLVGDLLSARWLDLREGDNFYIHNYHKRNPYAAKERAKRAKDAERKLKNRGKSERSADGTFVSHGVRPSGIRADVQTESAKSHAVPVPVPVPVPNSETHTPQAQEATRTEPVTVPPVEARDRALTAGQTQILEALQAHPALAQIATDRFASNLDGTLMTASFTLADMLAGIAELGPHAAGDAALGKPRLDTVLGKQVITYAKNLSERRKLSPRPDTPRGQGGAKTTAVQPRSPNADKWPSLDLLAGVDTTAPDFDPFALLPEGYPKK